MVERLHAILTRTWEVIADQVVSFLPKLLGSLIILVVGFVIARLIRALTVRFLVAIRFDRLSDRLGLSAFLARGDVRFTLAEVLATVIYWLVLLVSLQILGQVLGLEGLADFFGEILSYLPRVVVALVIILVGMGVGSFFGGAVQVGASHAGFPAARPLGQTVKYLISFFALVMALEELRIATQLLVSTLQIVIAAVALALALAFGLGCKDLAGEMVGGWWRRSQRPRATDPRPPQVPSGE